MIVIDSEEQLGTPEGKTVLAERTFEVAPMSPELFRCREKVVVPYDYGLP